MSKPIKPEDVGAQKANFIPEAVFDAFNAEIIAHFTHGSAKVIQERVVSRLIGGGMSRHEIFDSGMLNVEEAYRAMGWKVEYEKPGYNESGEAYFTFSTR